MPIAGQNLKVEQPHGLISVITRVMVNVTGFVKAVARPVVGCFTLLYIRQRTGGDAAQSGSRVMMIAYEPAQVIGNSGNTEFVLAI